MPLAISCALALSLARAPALRAAERSVRRETRHVERARPGNSRQRLAVESQSSFRELLAAGAKYSQLDVRGNSSALEQRLHPVAEAMQARRAVGSRPGARTDGIKIALAVEGGGMRGCVAAGMVAAIHHLGLTDSLDAVYGSSAGSLIGAYLLSRQDPRYGCSIYYEELPKAGRRFIDLRNVLRSLGLGALRVTPAGVSDLVQRRLGMPVLNLDQLLVEIVQRRKPLDFDRLWAGQPDQPLRVVASATASEGCGSWRSLPELAHCMRASMLLPGICGPVVPLNNSRGEARLRGTDRKSITSPLVEPHADAMLFEPIPYRLAVREGATHVLVLRTRPDGVNVVRRQSIFERLIAWRFFERKMRMPHMYKHMRDQQHRQRYAEDILLLNEAAKQSQADSGIHIRWRSGPGPPEPVQLCQVALQPGERGPEVSNLQTDAGVLAPLAHEGGSPLDGWQLALEVFPDSILEEVRASMAKPKPKPT
ncbi:hypothetical protein EMIHUDRAFT_463071 [Emiliania huxleyi CCMP1516]|uniref:PNPLA domain-containing protein n=2 Tax=Emiliania huxleyi TaxID=2903 RepID=A0A0D3JXT6_EMIH1|nr:hypothetical protein EMIHUDRAFT_463071 [Emiliania huxleyi CCMP1516]EOD28321.1 hypothetical protein EMIHUDRAFT_463071 [Emiliania huxleyi CCMP1516]|eukprot:XP_005780750.1 hypothetical protein EMIHUDRAFT_463071 [Emiliania huxleyi CCMP1516]